MSNNAAHAAPNTTTMATTADDLDTSPVAAAKDVISSIFGSAACVYTGQVRPLAVDMKHYDTRAIHYCSAAGADSRSLGAPPFSESIIAQMWTMKTSTLYRRRMKAKPTAYFGQRRYSSPPPSLAT